jgi:hypothetical protein
VHPNFAGVPWWAAVLIAVIGTLVGFAFDAGSADHELTGTFGVMYGLGCVAAVLAVQHAGLFTAVIQPPLILFVAVPGAYFVFHGGEFTGLKDTLINYGYPLIERFPLMLFTSAAVLLIGLVRWYFAAGSHVPESAADALDETAEPRASRFSVLAASARSLFNRGSDADGSESEMSEPQVQERPRRRHSANRSSSNRSGSSRSSATRSTGRRSAANRSTGEPRRSRSDRSAERSTPPRSRHARPPIDDEPTSRRGQRPSRSYEPYEPYRPRHVGSDYDELHSYGRPRSFDEPRSERPRSRSRDSDYQPIPPSRYRDFNERRPRRAPERAADREPDWRYDR